MGTAILAALRAIFIKLIASIATKSLLEWVLFWVADMIVKSTKMEQDDVFLAKLKEAYNTQESK